MNAIAEYSTSYPYLALARRRNIDYGAVLTYVDVQEHGGDETNRWVLRVLSDADKREIYHEMKREHARREERLKGES